MKRTRTEVETVLTELNAKRARLSDEIEKVTATLRTELNETNTIIRTTQLELRDIEEAEAIARKAKIEKAIHHEQGYILEKGKYFQEVAEALEKRILADHPGCYTYKLVIHFPREHSSLLWANPVEISKADFDITCEDHYNKTFDRLCEY
jgi:hypothetical protein